MKCFNMQTHHDSKTPLCLLLAAIMALTMDQRVWNLSAIWFKAQIKCGLCGNHAIKSYHSTFQSWLVFPSLSQALSLVSEGHVSSVIFNQFGTAEQIFQSTSFQVQPAQVKSVFSCLTKNLANNWCHSGVISESEGSDFR